MDILIIIIILAVSLINAVARHRRSVREKEGGGPPHGEEGLNPIEEFFQRLQRDISKKKPPSDESAVMAPPPSPAPPVVTKRERPRPRPPETPPAEGP